MIPDDEPDDIAPPTPLPEPDAPAPQPPLPPPVEVPPAPQSTPIDAIDDGVAGDAWPPGIPGMAGQPSPDVAAPPTLDAAGDEQGPLINRLLDEMERMRGQMQGMRDQIEALADPRGQIFFGNVAANDGTFFEVTPEGPGNVNFFTLQYGRAATGVTAADCPLIEPPPGVEAIISLPAGTARAYVPLGFGIRWAVITAINGDCKDSLTARRSKKDGTYLDSNPAHTITIYAYPQGTNCDPLVGLCFTVGDVVAYWPTGTNEGLLNSFYKQLQVNYVCTTNTASVLDTKTLRFADNDFDIDTHADAPCELDPRGPEAHIYWTGNMVKNGYDSSAYPRVKTWIFGGAATPPGGSFKLHNTWELTYAADTTPPVSMCDEPMSLGRKKLTLESVWDPGAYDTLCTKGSYTTIGDGSTSTADSDSWVRNSTTDLKVYTLTRLYWDTGANILYAFQVLKTFDSCGKLISCSAETRVTVDTAEAC